MVNDNSKQEDESVIAVVRTTGEEILAQGR